MDADNRRAVSTSLTTAEAEQVRRTAFDRRTTVSKLVRESLLRDGVITASAAPQGDSS